MLEIWVNPDYQCDLTTSLVSQGANQFNPVPSTSYEARYFIHSDNTQTFDYTSSQFFEIITNTKFIKYANLNSYVKETDSFIWRYVQFFDTDSVIWQSSSDPTQITFNAIRHTGYGMFKHIKLSILGLKGDEIENCEYYNDISQGLQWNQKKVIESYIQSYDNICEAFDIEWNSNYYQSGQFSVSVNASDVEVDIDLSQFAILSSPSGITTSYQQKIDCANFHFEIESRDDNDNQFQECQASIFEYETSSQQLCHNSSVQFIIQDTTKLRIISNSNNGTFNLYLWTYVVSQSDSTQIYNKRAAKFLIQIEPETEIQCGYEFIQKKFDAVQHEMTLDSTNLSLIKLSDYFNIDNNCTLSQFQISYDLSQTGPSQHLTFDSSKLEIQIQTNQDNQQSLSGLSQILSLRIQLVDQSQGIVLQEDSLNIFVQYQNITVTEMLEEIESDESVENQTESEIDQEEIEEISEVNEESKSQDKIYEEEKQKEIAENKIAMGQVRSYFRNLKFGGGRFDKSKSQKLQDDKDDNDLWKVKIKSVNSIGTLILEFIGDLSLFNATSINDYEKSLMIILKSNLDGQFIVGKAVGKNNKDQNNVQSNQRLLQNATKSFEWQKVDKNSNEKEVTIQLKFNHPNKISRDSSSYDQLVVIFKNQSQIDPLIATLPPQMKQEEFESVRASGERVKNGMKSSILITLIIQVLSGGVLSKLIMVLQTLNNFNLILMLEYKYDPDILHLIKYCVQAASFDIFDGPMIYNMLFEFRETEAFNTIFELFGFDSMNLIMISASMPISVFLIMIFSIMMKWVKFIAKMFYKRQCCRRLGMQAQKRDNLCTFLNTFIISNYQDISVNVSLHLFAIFSFKYSSHLSEWFEKADDIFCSSLALVTLITLVTLPLTTYYLFYKKIQGEPTNTNIHILFDGFNFDKQELSEVRTYIIIDLLIKLLRPLVFIFLDGHPVFQSQIFILTFLLTSCMLADIVPYNRKLEVRFQIFNNICFYLISICQTTYPLQSLNQNQTDAFKNWINILLQLTIIVNFASNIVVFIGYSVFMDKYKSYQMYQRRKYKKNQMNKKLQQRQKIMFKLGIGLFSDAHHLNNELNEFNILVQYAKERQWCLQNNLDVNQLDSEQLFKTKLKSKRYQLFKQYINCKTEIEDRILVQRAKKVSQEQQDQTREKQKAYLDEIHENQEQNDFQEDSRANYETDVENHSQTLQKIWTNQQNILKKLQQQNNHDQVDVKTKGKKFGKLSKQFQGKNQMLRGNNHTSFRLFADQSLAMPTIEEEKEDQYENEESNLQIIESHEINKNNIQQQNSISQSNEDQSQDNQDDNNIQKQIEKLKSYKDEIKRDGLIRPDLSMMQESMKRNYNGIGIKNKIQNKFTNTENIDFRDNKKQDLKGKNVNESLVEQIQEQDLDLMIEMKELIFDSLFYGEKEEERK